MDKQRYIEALNSKFESKRISAIKKIAKYYAKNQVQKSFDTAMQIHTNFSFSPYSPSLAVFMAHKFGLRVVGLMDNYSLQGAREFIKASRLLGVTYSVGTKVRVQTRIEGLGCCDVQIMGVASPFIDDLHKDLEKYRKNQLSNIGLTIEKINDRFKKYNISIDFEKDVEKAIKYRKDRVYLSKYAYLALAKKMLKKFDFESILNILKENKIELDDSELQLFKADNIYLDFDLANILFKRRIILFADKKYLASEGICDIAHKYGAFCTVTYSLKDVLSFSEENKKSAYKLINDVKSAGFDGINFKSEMMDDALLNYFLDEMEKAELLPFTINEIQFPRENFCSTYASERAKELMNRSAFVVVGSEMSQNQTGEGFISSTLKTITFEEKVDLFSRIGRGH